MKICYLTTGLGFGGAERELVQLAIGMKKHGHEVVVVSLLPLLGLAEELRAAGIEAESLRMSRGRPSLAALLALRRRFAELRPEVVHSFMWHANLMARLARRRDLVPVLISTAQNTHEGGLWRDRLTRWTSRLPELTSQVSRAGYQRYLEQKLALPARLEMIPNSVDVERFAPDEESRQALRAELGVEDRLVFLAVGRMDPQKGYPDLLAAFETVAPRVPRAVLLIAGDGPQRGELEGRVRGKGLEERVSFLGIRPDIARVLNAADVYVLSSLWEGTPLALLEAQATALPALATAADGTAEVVADGETGWLVPVSNPTALAERWLEVAALDDAERRAVGQRARARVAEHYGLPQTLARWRRVYDRLLAATRTGRAS